MSLSIHQNIHNKLDFFIKENKIPHIIFYGPSGSGKRTILNGFINDIYKNDKQKINQYVMHVNCAHSKGIRFIRDELKFFAKPIFIIKTIICLKVLYYLMQIN